MVECRALYSAIIVTVRREMSHKWENLGDSEFFVSAKSRYSPWQLTVDPVWAWQVSSKQIDVFFPYLISKLPFV